MNTPNIHSITSHLDQLLEVARYSDVALNGLQVESQVASVSKVGFAVDAGLSVITRAAQEGCQLLVVHHGLFWGGGGAIVGPLAKKLHACMTSGLSIYASHLPLDGHLEYGNAAQVGNLLGLTDVTPAFSLKGATIGILGTLKEPATSVEIASTLAQCEGALQPPFVLPFGPSHARRVGIATGSATSVISECAQLGVDLLITGESKQEAYHAAKEYGVSLVCMGHYASETFGVRALERVLREQFRVETTWISEPTGI